MDEFLFFSKDEQVVSNQISWLYNFGDRYFDIYKILKIFLSLKISSPMVCNKSSCNCLKSLKWWDKWVECDGCWMYCCMRGWYGHQQSLRWELQRQNYYIDISGIFSWRVKPKMPQNLKYNTQLIISASFFAVILTSGVDYAYAF